MAGNPSAHLPGRVLRGDGVVVAEISRVALFLQIVSYTLFFLDSSRTFLFR